MSTPAEKLAESLRVLKGLQSEGRVAIRSRELPRTHRERLVAGGFLQEVMKGWYTPVRPDEGRGGTTSWYSAYWPFCAGYLRERFGDSWCLSPEQSLLLHSGDRTVPRQLLVRTPKGGNKVAGLLYGTSLLDVRAAMPRERDIVQRDGLRLFSLPAALVASAPGFFNQHPTEARAALAMIKDSSELLDCLLAGGHSKIAGRLAGGLRNIGAGRRADEVLETMRSAGYVVREEDPFDSPAPRQLSARESSPYVHRLQLMWAEMRGPIVENFPGSPGLPANPVGFLAQVEDLYTADAYHSLSIEGYQVSTELIERVRTGNWNPDGDDGDRVHRDALAARGYWQAFRAVESSLERVLGGDNAGTVAEEDHRGWYRQMFAPGVAAGIVRASDLAGYRNEQVYIRGSMHVPPRHDAIRDLMPAFFELLAGEAEPAVRAVLGHFAFVYIHPYMDGNGRMGRFLMNLMLASGGYPWTVIPVTRRDEYMAALEDASVRRNITPFAKFIAGLVKRGID